MRLAVAAGFLARDLLDLADVEPARDNFFREPLRIVMTHQGAGVTGAQPARLDMFLDPIGQRLQPQCIGNVAAALADHAGNVVLAVAEIADQRTVALRLFERIKVGTLHVLDDGKLQGFLVARFDDDDGHFVQAGTLRRAPAPFAGDDLESVGRAAHRPRHDRLNHAALAQRRGQFIQLNVGEDAPRIARIRPQRSGRHAPLAARTLGRALGADVTDQGCKSAAQSRSRCVLRHRRLPQIFTHKTIPRLLLHVSWRPPAIAGHAQLASSSFSRWMISVASRR